MIPTYPPLRLQIGPAADLLEDLTLPRVDDPDCWIWIRQMRYLHEEPQSHATGTVGTGLVKFLQNTVF
jgi:hypothetical protein